MPKAGASLVLEADRRAEGRVTRRRHVRLDAPAGGRLTVAELLGASLEDESDERSMHELTTESGLVTYLCETLGEDGVLDDETRLSLAGVKVFEIVGFPGLSDQQRLVLLAKHFLLTSREDDSYHAIARLLGWNGRSGAARVSRQWRRVLEKLFAARAGGYVDGSEPDAA
ncbi:MAG TPA: hypothetical protein VIP11_17960 [Gemmatimonadaceae bacterium]